MIAYEKSCFVIMPFGTKILNGTEINFEYIYKTVFEPAIAATILPEGGTLVPVRADDNFLSGDVTEYIFRVLEHSRLVLADITGMNANVMYELGVRYRAQQSGTVIFRQVDAPVPFDISSTKAFPYKWRTSSEAAESRSLIQRVLAETLSREPRPKVDTDDEARKPSIFVAMPFSDEMMDVWQFGIRGPAIASDFLCHRMDEEVFLGDVVQAIKEHICQADLVVAEMTGYNPNVLLEVGYAWGRGIPTLLLERVNLKPARKKQEENRPFDIRGQRRIDYKQIVDLSERLESDLRELRKSILNRDVGT
jgi:hypothetical protein